MTAPQYLYPNNRSLLLKGPSTKLISEDQRLRLTQSAVQTQTTYVYKTFDHLRQKMRDHSGYDEPIPLPAPGTVLTFMEGRFTIRNVERVYALGHSAPVDFLAGVAKTVEFNLDD
jgi:hypothetical protein